MIRVGIVGYGNLGKSVRKGIELTSDMEVAGIFSRRKLDLDLYRPLLNIKEYKDQIDLLILCGSSDKDILCQGPELLKDFNTLDSFDNHSKIKEYYYQMDKIGKENGSLALISTGWDPGLFSLNRILGTAILPEGESFTLWGKGVSQGHSAAVRSIDGVLDATQYTIPKPEILEKIRSGGVFEFDSHKAHLREVYAVIEDGADEKEIEEKIKSMPDYFAPYQTQVHFISQEELDKNHKKMLHGGHVIRRGKASGDGDALIEFNLDLQSNPDFTAAVDIAYARALYRLSKEGKKGAITVLDVAPKYLSEESYDSLLNLI
ncbi:diaminopimelate dehydrogenase [uncultured Anaerococcus sp.]|uniref:diaminopimelate dehydrogenase n=1 Tax=uncultured Anaerococcus sp. TaxID=293428 RepID=UPI00288A0317|nr:diaminopimelate dehydrogenase [uncultured Anaerococcus sp.]